MLRGPIFKRLKLSVLVPGLKHFSMEQLLEKVIYCVHTPPSSTEYTYTSYKEENTKDRRPDLSTANILHFKGTVPLDNLIRDFLLVLLEQLELDLNSIPI